MTDYMRVLATPTRGGWEMDGASALYDFFLVPKGIDSDRPIALFATLVRWWEEGKIGADD